MAEVSRRTVVLGAAWSVPVIAAAVAVPLAAASTPPTPMPVWEFCERIDAKGQPTYLAKPFGGEPRVVTQGEVNSDKELQALCRNKGPKS